MHQGKTAGKLQVLPEENWDGHVEPFQAGTEADRGITEASTFKAKVCVDKEVQLLHTLSEGSFLPHGVPLALNNAFSCFHVLALGKYSVKSDDPVRKGR